MPSKPKTSGQRAGRTGKAGQHKARQRYDQRRQADPSKARSAQIRSKSTWQEMRAYMLANHPACVDPLNRHGWKHPVDAKQVHHIVGLEDREDLALVATNCAPLCTQCHGRIEQKERKGANTQQLFVGWQSYVERQERQGWPEATQYWKAVRRA